MSAFHPPQSLPQSGMAVRYRDVRESHALSYMGANRTPDNLLSHKSE